MPKPIQRIAVTGASGNIAYSLLFRLAQGELLGKEQPIALHLLEVEAGFPLLQAVEMELKDCAFPLLEEIKIGTDPFSLFEGIDYAFLIGAKPRGPGMERKDLIAANGAIFAEQGKALNRSANRNVVSLVLGNPCNTNALIAIHNAPDLPATNFHAMTRLDQTRAQSFLAEKAKASISEIKKVAIWGNHSATQVPDFIHAEVAGKKIVEVISDKNWLYHDFMPLVQKRGAEIIKARGKSSAGSASHAALLAMRDLIFPTSLDTFFSSGVYTKNSPYPIDEDLVFSFPCIYTAEKGCQIVKNLSWNDFLEEKIRITEKELLEERELALTLLS